MNRYSRAAMMLLFGVLSPAFALAQSGPETGNSCEIFADDTDFVTSTILMDLEDKEIPLSIPKRFFEDRADQNDGGRFTSQLFRVSISGFEPVTRSDTAKPEMKAVHEWMSFLVGDYVPLNEITEIYLDHANLSTPREDIAQYQQSAGPYGLSLMVPLDDFVSRNVFVDKSDANAIQTVISCSTPESVKYPRCSQNFRSSGLDIKVSYRRAELVNWRTIQHDISNFLACSQPHNNQ